MTQTKNFPNGFSSWAETHYEMVVAIENNSDSEIVQNRELEQGTGGLYELSIELTDKFEEKHKDVEWGCDENTQYFDAFDEFLEENL